MCLCVSTVSNFEVALKTWFWAPKLKKEHGSHTKMIESLTEELRWLCLDFAMQTGWKVDEGPQAKAKPKKRRYEEVSPSIPICVVVNMQCIGRALLLILASGSLCGHVVQAGQNRLGEAGLQR